MGGGGTRRGRKDGGGGGNAGGGAGVGANAMGAANESNTMPAQRQKGKHEQRYVQQYRRT